MYGEMYSMSCKVCETNKEQIEYLKTIIAGLQEENKDLLNRVLTKNNIAPINQEDEDEKELEVEPLTEGELYGTQ